METETEIEIYSLALQQSHLHLHLQVASGAFGKKILQSKLELYVFLRLENTNEIVLL